MMLQCSMQSKARRKLKQHLGIELPVSSPHPLWLHACSMGEVASTAPLVNSLLDKNIPVHITVVTATGMDHIKRLFGDKVSASFLPWDIPGLMHRLVTHLRPRLLLLTETEFWPGLLSACHRGGVPVLGINTRISDRSFPRYHASRWLWRRWLKHVEIFFSQSQLDADRLQAIGVDKKRIRVICNLKYAVSAPDVDASSLRKRLDPGETRPILLAASTHADEEARLLNMLPSWKRVRPDLILALVPRHPERFDEVGDLVKQFGFRLCRWSESPDIACLAKADVILVDVMGALRELYTIADLVFIGGSLVPVGGHNPLEAAICGRSVVTGPHMQNFRDIIEDMKRQSAALTAKDTREVDQFFCSLLGSPEDLQSMHARAAVFMRDRSKVLPAIIRAIEPYLE